MSRLRISQIRLLSTTATKPTVEPYYNIKKQVDEFTYYHSLRPKYKPLVYRFKNTHKLDSLNLIDHDGKPLINREYPGIPSIIKFNKFIQNLIFIEELQNVKKSLIKLDDTNIGRDFIKPSLINSYLLKSCTFGEFNKELMFIKSLKNFENFKGGRLIEFLFCLRTIEFRQLGIVNVDNCLNKIKRGLKYINDSKSDIENHNTTDLIELSKLSMLVQVELNQLNSNEESHDSQRLQNEINKILSNLTTIKNYEINENAMLNKDGAISYFGRFEHRYTVVKLFVDTVMQLPVDKQLQYNQLLNQLQPWLVKMDELKKIANIKRGMYHILTTRCKFQQPPPQPQQSE
ncbi:hypothetical protein CANARDRAFT_214899 [[Candida] arabinofermentans NRRL YB-2248]|uniref:Uncharacterized protein n=1 Tax=[Candida] arabinofermentans NRRL YB-2248 TaxID=983967 RepID=A0A1E4STX2_9ASCO|nr:hypothetical protein CANARDRAFT_214899 [[Candida] arabinofermentans NRRL YB-2248]